MILHFYHGSTQDSRAPGIEKAGARSSDDLDHPASQVSPALHATPRKASFCALNDSFSSATYLLYALFDMCKWDVLGSCAVGLVKSIVTHMRPSQSVFSLISIFGLFGFAKQYALDCTGPKNTH